MSYEYHLVEVNPEGIRAMFCFPTQHFMDWMMVEISRLSDAIILIIVMRRRPNGIAYVFTKVLSTYQDDLRFPTKNHHPRQTSP